MNTCADMKVGDIVNFIYDGGSAPGSHRRVKLESVMVQANSFAGEDMSLQVLADGSYPYRQFNMNLARDIEIEGSDEPCECVSFVAVQDNVKEQICQLPPDELGDLYHKLCEPKAKCVEFDDNKGEFAVQLPQPELLSTSENEYECEITNVDGETLCLDFEENDIYVNNVRVTVTGMVKLLQKHLDI